MGENAKRKSDGAVIKIGTCERMYYLRYEDREKVAKIPHSLDPMDSKGLFFRLPFPDEDHLQPGDYDHYNRGLVLYRRVGQYQEYFEDPSTAEDPGIMQLKHERSGLMLNVPCYHGAKLPEVQKPMQAFWNGKGHSLELIAVKDTGEGVLPVIGCVHCGGMWRYQWADVLDFIEPEMCDRLRVHTKAAANA